MATNERPILFSAPMVRALLSGDKTQTRRVVKWRNVAPGLNLAFSGLSAWGQADGWRLGSRRGDGAWEERCDPTPCPYGRPGGRLWVRETWQAVNGDDRARFIVNHPRPGRGWLEYAATPRFDEPAPRWRASIHMPRWASRIALEVTEVRVQRLHDISELDAHAEGLIDLVPRANRSEGLTPGALCLAAAATVDAMPRTSRRGFLAGALAASLGFAASPSRPWEVVPKRWTRAPSAREVYAVLWESINGPGSWATNPWVWAVSFRRVGGHGT